MATTFGSRDSLVFSVGANNLHMKIAHDANDTFYEIDTQKTSIASLFGADINNNGVILPHRSKVWPLHDFWVVSGMNQKVPFFLVGYTFYENDNFWDAPLVRYAQIIIVFVLGFILVKKFKRCVFNTIYHDKNNTSMFGNEQNEH
jgi:hypothetical protein